METTNKIKCDLCGTEKDLIVVNGKLSKLILCHSCAKKILTEILSYEEEK